MQTDLLPLPHTGVSCALGGTVLALVLALTLGLTACAHVPPPTVATGLLHDEWYPPPPHAIDTREVFALSDAMRRYADAELAPAQRRRDPRRALLDALYSRPQLRLAYDASHTRNAAEAFDARAGNCLSLVIMTAAFAKYLGLPVAYRRVRAAPHYSLTDDLTFASGHVNLVLKNPRAGVSVAATWSEDHDLTVDFLPGADLQHQQTDALQEATILAMYMNNRAAEGLVRGDLNQAYAWARLAVQQDPAYAAATNTLAVIYLRSGHAAAAVAAWRYTLAHAPDNTAALSNLAHWLRGAGRAPEAEGLARRLARLQPNPPFHFLRLGQQALAAGDAAAARELFLRELRLQPAQSDVHFWTAQAYLGLGDNPQAARHLRLAQQHSTSLDGEQRYAGKLDRLRSLAPGAVPAAPVMPE